MKKRMQRYLNQWSLATFFLFISVLGCKNPVLENLCDPNFPGYFQSILFKILSGDTTNHCSVKLNQVFFPVFSPPPGAYTEPAFISITSFTPGAIIYITTDGSLPTTDATPYTSPSSIWRLSGQRIRAVATKPGMENSPVAEAMYSLIPLKTGQTFIYASGDDGSIGSGFSTNYSGPNPDPNFPNDHTTFDQSKGILWKSCSEGLEGVNCSINNPGVVATGITTFTTSCSSLNAANSGKGYAGKTSWRLPTMRELLTTNDASKTSVTIQSASAFPATVNFAYWASTQYSPNLGYAWYLDYSNSNSYATFNTNSYYGRCVASLPPIETFSFVDNKDGTIRDNVTALTWQKCTYGQNNDATCSGAAIAIDWSSAITYCSSLSLGSKSWRLPNRNELISLYDYTKSTGPTIDQTNFPNTIATVAGYYWTSTTNASGTSSAWYVNFTTTLNNIFDVNAKTNSLFVRCVAN
ncbi:DUF1566 domain-containing protein [Leptospira jelokensis]|uniref:Lcl domain-containing protein n=1 Tax=Leptospira jelokensis TaxID=2484931 RepID=UPI00143849A8|nr:DUF1566 domain-containing protein [Leptospira jelokensis]